jgi:outer membrane protein TolC
MKVQNIYIGAACVALAAMTTSCGIYKKYETPQNTALTQAYVEARDAQVDSTALGNLLWEDVFTDPVLADLINRALVNNTSLKNAQLNVEMAQAQLKGAKLAYFPSLAISPNGAGASYAGSNISWSYTIPATLSWEVDIFGKLLNSKRSAAVAVETSEAYAQAVRSQIICSVANVYYAMSSVECACHRSRRCAKRCQLSVSARFNHRPRSVAPRARQHHVAVAQHHASALERSSRQDT